MVTLEQLELQILVRIVFRYFAKTKMPSIPLNSSVTEVPVILRPVHWFAEQINGLVLI